MCSWQALERVGVDFMNAGFRWEKTKPAGDSQDCN